MLKKLSVLLVAAIAVFSCSATGIQRCLVKSMVSQTNVFKAKAVKEVKPEVKEFCPQLTPCFNVTDDAIMHTVTLKAVYNEEDYESPGTCGIQNKDIAQYPYFNENGIASVELPEGVYCASIMFTPSDGSLMERKIPRMVFVEDIEVDQDITVEFNPEMASCLVNFQPLLPNGEVMTLKRYGDFNFDTFEYEIIPGNTEEIASVDIIWHEDFGGLRSSGQSSNYMRDDMNIYDKWSLYVNPLSDKITILRGVVASTENDGYYVTLMDPIKGIQSSQDDKWSTDYSSDYTISTVHTEMFDKIPEDAWKNIPRSMLTVDLVYPDGQKFFMPIGVASNGFSIRAAGLFSENQILTAAFTGSETDAAIEVWGEDEEGNDVVVAYSYTATSMPAFFFTEEGGQDFVSLPLDAGLIATEEWSTDFGNPNEWYSFYNNEMSGEFGASQPIACLNWRPQFDYEFDYETFEMKVIRSNILFNTPVGRLSDIIGADNLSSHATLTTLDSDKVWDDPDRTDKSRVEMNAEFSCQTIDGLQGKTKAYLYWDENKEDCYPPVLTMLQFRDVTSGIVTDRFDCAADAKVILSGNDFNVRIINEDTYPQVLFDEAPAEMKLEWRATDATEDSEWTQLDLSDLDCGIRGFGKMYEASLMSVNGTSASGWFDVKISMTDEAGNNMSQTVSPAFKIMNAVSVNEIDSETVEAQYYDLQGRIVKNPAAGLYIVRSGEKVCKKIVKKN